MTLESQYKQWLDENSHQQISFEEWLEKWDVFNSPSGSIVIDNLNKESLEKISADIKKLEDEFLNDPNIPEETKKGWIEGNKKIEEKFKAEEEEYQIWLEANKHKKIIGYNPENFRPIFEDEQYNPKDIKYGLIAIDPTEEGENKTILHFCGYWDEPKKEDAESLLEELKTDEEFGLTDIAHRLIIIPCPDELVKEFIKEIQ